MASHLQKTVALQHYFTPGQIMHRQDHYLQPCATNRGLSGQLQGVSVCRSGFWPQMSAHFTGFSFQDLASLLGFTCLQLHQGRNAHAKSLERLSALSYKIREELGVVPLLPATQQGGPMMAFIIFYCDRKANASLNLGRVQQAYSSTEGFSDGINVVLSKLCSDFDTQ